MTKEIISISHKEYMVIALLADGFTDKQIGDKLKWSETEVSSTIEILLHRLCVHHPFELISWAYMKGIMK